MIFHFLRWPYDWLAEKIKDSKSIERTRSILGEEKKKLRDNILSREALTQNDIKQANDLAIEVGRIMDRIADAKVSRFWHVLFLNILKPIIGCGTCMASFWTIVYALIFGCVINEIMILVMFIVAFLNSILIAVYDLLSTAILWLRK